MDFKTDFKPLTVDPDKIYDYSFSIIAEEMGNHDFSEDEWKIVRRVIHASADFELGRSVIIHPNAIQAGVEAIRKGRHVIADVQMIESGTGKKRFQKHGGDVHCYISDPDVMVEAKRLNTTRAGRKLKTRTRQRKER